MKFESLVRAAKSWHSLGSVVAGSQVTNVRNDNE